MTNRQRTWIFIAAGLSGTAIFGFFGYMVWTMVQGMGKPGSLSEADKRLVVRVASLAQFGIVPTSTAGETFTAIPQFGTTPYIQYEYSSRKDPVATKYLYMNCMAQAHPIAASAVQTFQMQKATYRTTFKFMPGAKIVDMPELVGDLGDARYAATILSKDGQPGGNLFVLRQGRVVHTVMLTGVAFQRPEDVKRLLDPILVESRRRYAAKR
ncbi:MAG: hypothetical protein ACLGH0_07080 [Thermoanaerobaculia bacterium]